MPQKPIPWAELGAMHMDHSQPLRQVGQACPVEGHIVLCQLGKPLEGADRIREQVYPHGLDSASKLHGEQVEGWLDALGYPLQALLYGLKDGGKSG
jgi:hypothetical protein